MSSINGDPGPSSSNHQTSEELDFLASDLAQKYAAFVQIDTSKESQQLRDSIEQNLSCLEKFCHDLEVIRSNSTVCLDTLYPNLISRVKEMHKVYVEIDSLEQIIGVIKNSTETMEEEVNQAETALDSVSTVKKLLSIFRSTSLSSSSQDVGGSRVKEFHPPSIFSTKELFGQDEAVEVHESSHLD